MNDRPAEAAVQEEQRAQTRLALGARSSLYFGGLGVGTGLLTLLAWTGVIVALLLLPISRKLERQRDRSGPRSIVRTATQ